MPIVTIHQAKTNLSKLIQKAAAGEEVIIARGAKPVARLVAVGEVKGKRLPGSLVRCAWARNFLSLFPKTSCRTGSSPIARIAGHPRFVVVAF
jgi:prevent-host-death family protein